MSYLTIDALGQRKDNLGNKTIKFNKLNVKIIKTFRSVKNV